MTQLKFHLSPKNHVQLARDDDDSKKSRRRKTSVMDSLELDDHQAVLTARQVSYYADLLGGANEAYAEKKGYKSHEFLTGFARISSLRRAIRSRNLSNG